MPLMLPSLPWSVPEAHRRIALDVLDVQSPRARPAGCRTPPRHSGNRRTAWGRARLTARQPQRISASSAVDAARERQRRRDGETGGAGGFGASALPAPARTQVELAGRRPASACTLLPGTEAGLRSSHCGLPPDCACRCSAGSSRPTSPADRMARSRRARRTGPGICVRRRTTRRLPCAAITTAPAITVTPRRRAASGRMPVDARASTTTGAAIGQIDGRLIGAVIVGEHTASRPAARHNDGYRPTRPRPITPGRSLLPTARASTTTTAPQSARSMAA